jgi:hypothetical protein
MLLWQRLYRVVRQCPRQAIHRKLQRLLATPLQLLCADQAARPRLKPPGSRRHIVHVSLQTQLRLSQPRIYLTMTFLVSTSPLRPLRHRSVSLI